MSCGVIQRLCAVTVLLCAAVGGCSSPAGQSSPESAVSPGTTSSSAPAAPAPAVEVSDPAVAPEFARLESVHDARLGVYAVDTGSGRAVAYGADERFAYASTFKAFAAALVLAGTTPAQFEEPVRVEPADLLANSPVTEARAGTTMTWRELCDAAVRYSDNTAGNLLLRRLGGPGGYDTALTDLGDDVTSADRYEPDLSSAVPGDPRDTSTPRAMAHNLREFALGDALDDADREVFLGWLRGNTTGATVVRAGVPEGWVVGDKTGTASYGGRNDIAVVWPPDRDPIIIAVMTSRDREGADQVDALIADATRVVVRVLG